MASKAFTVFAGSTVGLLVSFLISVFVKLKQTEQSLSVTSGARPPPPPTPRLMAVYKFHILQIHVHRGEKIGQIPSSLPRYRRPLFLLDLQNGQGDHVTRQANGMWWEERWVWVSFSMLDDLRKLA